jgi:hypothetical protein
LMYLVSFISRIVKQIVANPHTFCTMSKTEVEVYWITVCEELSLMFIPVSWLKALSLAVGGVN